MNPHLLTNAYSARQEQSYYYQQFMKKGFDGFIILIKRVSIKLVLFVHMLA